MKKLNLSSYGVEEMSQQEMLNVEGGCKVFKAIGNAAKAVAGAIADAAEAVADAAVVAYNWASEHVNQGNQGPCNIYNNCPQ
jgi:hypothetical protein